MPQTDIARPESIQGGLVSTFAEKTGVDMKNTNDLMNWLIFGKETKLYDKILPSASMTF